ncbi:MAG: alanine racemase [Gemmatimonadetes bacterium]|nr:alanine racemase [Gemmatimonadota bacterium]
MSPDALRLNFRRISDSVGPASGVLPMVKADAYGVGVEGVVACLEPEGPWGFGVATVGEGMDLRSGGYEGRILVCGPIPLGEIDGALGADLELSVSSLCALHAMVEAASRTERGPRVHVDVDTGMGRSGFDWRKVNEWLPGLKKVGEEVTWVGAYTHLHSADADDSVAAEASIRAQWNRFDAVRQRLIAELGIPLVHVLNSAGAFRAPALGNAIVRPGIYLYGGRIGGGQPKPEPVVSLHARVVHVREAAAGTTLGYGSTYVASSDERWATLSIGYGDGLPRALGNRGYALVGDVRVPIIGRISMDVTVVDITGVPAVVEGDVATLIGTQGAETISLDEVAGLAGTISYEILTGLTPRLPRVWSDVEEGPSS